MWMRCLIGSFFVVLVFGQGGVLSGIVKDAQTQEPLQGATIRIVGTYLGTYSDEQGRFKIENIKPGDYSVRVTYVGYTEALLTAVRIEANRTTTIEVALKPQGTTLETVEIVGEAALINLETASSEFTIESSEIQDLVAASNVQSLVTMQVGVQQTLDGIQIRGGRVYETQYVVDNINAQDPLAGTGFGVEVAKSAIDQLKVVTSGADPEYGDGTSGTIITKIKEGGELLQVQMEYKKDNFGVRHNEGMHWNSDALYFAIGGPVPKTNKKLRFFLSGNMDITDTYFRIRAKQLHSSLLEEDGFSKMVQKVLGEAYTKDRIFAPRQDNRWSATGKLSYYINSSTKLTLTILQSLNINQNTRSLQIIGNNAILQPGLQWAFALQPDNANTYTHRSNLTILNFRKVFRSRWVLNLAMGRLFTNLRADANGRPFRDSIIKQIYDPASIVTDPVTLYNPGDSVVYVNPGPGLYNNGGIATLWHDHFAEEWTVKLKWHYIPKSPVHFLTFGIEHREQYYQWIDVRRPWIGAPIKINDTLTFSSNRIGQSNDIWRVRPATGGFFFEDRIRYKGIIASLGVRLTYWAPGRFADEAVENPQSPVLDVIREEYKKQTVKILNRRYKARLLPKLRVSFPVTENNVLYFNYSQSTRLPHPRFLYAGLDPVYQNRSFLANLGNPNLNPETSIGYEVGLKSLLTANTAITISAFYIDKYDYIVVRRVDVRDQTGRFVTKVMAINQDYARIRGLEIAFHKRIGKWFYGVVNGAYQVATGKSNSARESLLQIQQMGRVPTTREMYLAWDRPFEFKAYVIIRSDSSWHIGPIPLKNFVLSVEATWKSGLRYTPYRFDRYDETTGRPIYVKEEDKPFAKIGTPWRWINVRIARRFVVGSVQFLLFFEVENLFNFKNAAIINPVTGRAYEYPDPVPLYWRDPAYPNPLDRGLPPDNPARYLQPRHLWWGIQFRL